MGLFEENFRMLYVGAAAAVYFRPDYAILNSRLITVTVCFAILTVSKLIYQLVLYPSFFTPVKHIQTPGVSTDHQLSLKYHS